MDILDIICKLNFDEDYNFINNIMNNTFKYYNKDKEYNITNNYSKEIKKSFLKDNEEYIWNLIFLDIRI